MHNILNLVYRSSVNVYTNIDYNFLVKFTFTFYVLKITFCLLIYKQNFNQIRFRNATKIWKVNQQIKKLDFLLKKIIIFDFFQHYKNTFVCQCKMLISLFITLNRLSHCIGFAFKCPNGNDQEQVSITAQRIYKSLALSWCNKDIQMRFHNQLMSISSIAIKTNRNLPSMHMFSIHMQKRTCKTVQIT